VTVLAIAGWWCSFLHPMGVKLNCQETEVGDRGSEKLIIGKFLRSYVCVPEQQCINTDQRSCSKLQENLSWDLYQGQE
jgi:hypothetical protein